MKRSKFTLIEVLVAGVILTTVILLVSQAQRQNTLVTKRILFHEKKLEVAFFIKKQILSQMRQGEKRGEGKWGKWAFEWSATESESAMTRKDPTNPIAARYKIVLYNVGVAMKTENFEYEFEFLKTEKGR